MALLSDYLIARRHAIVRPYLRGRVLDLGCGRAEATSMLAPGQRYVGIEVDRAHVSHLREQFPEREFHTRDLNRDHLALGERHFDTIVLLAVIEHLERPLWLLSEVRAYMDVDSFLLITTPSRRGDHMLRVGVRLGLFHPHGIGAHRGIYERSEMESLLTEAGLRLVRTQLFSFGANQLFVCRTAEPT